MPAKLRILSIQPFYGGSHRALIDGWIRNSRHDWSMLTLPDRYWKWRMRHSAIYMSEQVNELVSTGREFDVLVCTDMLNLAEFRGLVSPEVRAIPVLAYFHENQLNYPTTKEEPRDYHFAFTNLTTTIAADQVWFNSAFNRDSMIAELEQAVTKWPDYGPVEAIDKIAKKSSIQYPGIEERAMKTERADSSSIHLIWAARWEHDKNPELLLSALTILQNQDIDFRISLIGQTFRNVPPSILEIKRLFDSRIVHWGFLSEREDYWSAIESADVFISTANHEFFGLSVAEAASIGLHVLLPDRLSYPELLNVVACPIRRREHLYDGSPQDLVRQLKRLADQVARGQFKPCLELARYFQSTFGWKSRARQMDDEVERLC